MGTLYDKNIQLNAPYRYLLATQLGHLISLANGCEFVCELRGCAFDSTTVT